MNTSTTDNQAHEHEMSHDEFRQMLIASRQQAPRHYDFHGERASIWECLTWGAFAALMLAGLAEAILWGLR